MTKISLKCGKKEKKEMKNSWMKNEKSLSLYELFPENWRWFAAENRVKGNIHSHLLQKVTSV